MASSTTTNIDIETSNLEVECHYLSQALKKLQRRSPEWSYLHQRLATAEEELEAMRQDLREMETEMETVQFHYPSPSAPPTPGQQVVLDDGDDTSNDHMCDMAVIDPDLTDIRRPLHEDDDDDASCQPFIFCKSSTDETTSTTREKIRSHLSLGIKVAMLITGILLITCNIERHSNSSEAASDADITHSALPVPNNDQWEADFSSLLSNLQPHDGPCASFTLHLVTDQFGNETSWELISVSDSSSGSNDALIEDESYLRKRISRVATPPPPSPPSPPSPPQTIVLLSGGPYPYQDFDRDASFKDHDSAIIAKACLPVGSYKFVLHDVQRDGICCDYGRGEYGLNLSKGRVIRPLSSGTFMGENEVTSFQVTEDDIDIIPESTDSIKESIASSMPTVGTNPPTVPDVNPLNNLVTALDMDMITGSGKSYGVLFDIETTTSVVIAGMELVLSATSPTYYEIWSKEGSWQDVNVDEPNYFEGFRRVSRGSIDGQGASEFSYIPLHEFHDIEIQGGGQHAFWITLSDDHLAFVNYDDEERSISRHEMQSDVQVSSAELNVMYGAAVRAYSLELADPETDFHYNAGFLGRVWYRTLL